MLSDADMSQLAADIEAELPKVGTILRGGTTGEERVEAEGVPCDVVKPDAQAAVTLAAYAGSAAVQPQAVRQITMKRGQDLRINDVVRVDGQRYKITDVERDTTQQLPVTLALAIRVDR